MIDHSNSIDDAIRANGMNPPNNLKPCEICRFPGAGKEETNRAGWCFLFDDGNGGVIGDYSRNLKVVWQKKREKPMTPEELAAFNKKAEEARQIVDAERAKTQAVASNKANEIWQQSTLACENHPYLVKKDVQPIGIRQDENGQLVIPLLDCKGIIQSLQFIDENGVKKFLKGGRIKGCFFVVDSEDASDEIFSIAEGYATAASIHHATGYPVAVAFNAGNLKAVAEAIREEDPGVKIVICADDDHYTEGNPGITMASEAALAVGGWLAIPEFGEYRKEWGEDEERPAVILTDFNDLHNLLDLEAVRTCIETARQSTDIQSTQYDKSTLPSEEGNMSSDDNAVIQRLVGLSAMEYDRARKIEAKALGIRPGTLDQMVQDARTEEGVDEAGITFEAVEPWDDPVEPAKLLNEISDAVVRFIVCTVETAIAVALWVAMTWFIAVVQVAPLAVITAPEKRCGKTLLLNLLGKLVARALMSSNITPAALYRAIEKWKPTLLIDEVDAFLKDNEELRGIINAGHTRDSAFTVRCVGDTHEPKIFNIWGAKALSGIGDVAGTLMDRAVILRLRRKLPHEKVLRIRNAEPDLFTNLRSKLARFAEDFSERVRQARPDLPAQLNDRAQDNWEPLLAIADVAGADWPEKARAAALKLSGESDAGKSVGVELLADIQEVLEIKRGDKIFTADLITALVEDEEKPWATYNRGFPIKPRQISKRLAEYGISSNTIRIGLVTRKGYRREQFNEAFSRYLGPPIAE